MRLVGFFIRHFIPIGLTGVFALILVSGAVPSQTAMFQGFGLELSAISGINPQNVEPAMNQVAATGVKFLRVEMDWPQVETSADTYEWNTGLPLDQIITLANTQEIEVVAVLNGGPAYLAVPGQLLDQEVVGQRWEKFVQAAAEHFGDTVNIWEIGSNLNSSRGISPFLSPLDPDRLLNPDPVFYTRLLHSANKIIKAVDASDQVWMGSLTGLAANECLLSPLTFLLEVNAAGGWKYADAIPYTPRQGGATPEITPAGIENTSCASALMTTPVSMADEVQAVQQLVRQLGQKPVIITNLDWRNDDLRGMNKGRATTIQQLKADLLTRASISLIGQNSLPTVFWNLNVLKNGSGTAAITNLQDILQNSTALGQAQGQAGTVQEYRFRNGAETYILAWRDREGDASIPVNLDLSEFKQVTLSQVDALNSDNKNEITLDPTGQALLMLNERPVILHARSGNLAENLQAETNQEIEILRQEMNKVLRSWGNQLKGAALKMVDKWFDSAKQDAVEWGEGVINELIP